MKKLFLSLLSLALPAFATLAADVLYVNGDAGQNVNGVQIPSWTVETPVEVTPVDGFFQITVENYSNIGISTAKGDWSAWNAGQYSISEWNTDANNDKANLENYFGKTSAFINKTVAMAAPRGAKGGTFTFIIDQDLTTCQILPHTLYLAGPASTKINGNALASWSIDPAVAIPLKDGKFTFDIEVANDYSFDISLTNISGQNIGSDYQWAYYSCTMQYAVITENDMDKPVALVPMDGQVFKLPEAPDRYYTVEISRDLKQVTVGSKKYQTLYVNGDETQTVNGQTTAWTIHDPVEIQAQDGKFIIHVANFQSLGLSKAKEENRDNSDWNTSWNPALIQIPVSSKTIGQPLTISNTHSATMAGSADNGLKGSDITIEIAQDLSGAKVTLNSLVLAAGQNAVINGVVSADWNMKEPFIIPLSDNGAFTFEVNSASSVDLATCSSDGLEWTTWQNAAGISISPDATPGEPSEVVWGKSLVLKGMMSQIVTVSGDLKTITITPENEETAKVFLVGEHNAFAMNPNDTKWQFEKAEDNNYYLDCIGETVIPADKGFQISARGWRNSPVCYAYDGTLTDEHLSTPELTAPMTWAWGTGSAKFAQDYTGTIRLELPSKTERADGQNATLYFYDRVVDHNSISSGIGAAEVSADAPKEYFNLQGVAVEHPGSGLYIVRKGSKVSKVYIK